MSSRCSFDPEYKLQIIKMIRDDSAASSVNADRKLTHPGPESLK